MKNRIRFIEADMCPMQARGGWIVPDPSVQPQVTVDEMVARLCLIGLTENVDYRILGQGWDVKGFHLEALKRVMFDTDEAFIMAKMTL